MNTSSLNGAQTALATLRRLARPTDEVEQCEFCSARLGAVHRHLFDLATRKLICACDPCALRFENVLGRWRLIPRDPRLFSDFRMTDAEWEFLSLPIQLVFIFRSSAADKVVAMYPSPAGATESLLSLNSWQNLVSANPCLSSIEPDVEALLVNRLAAANPLYYLAPIDVCFELAGLIRLHWRGLSGGDNLWREIENFFARLRARARDQSTARPELAHA
jgi:hypothetical protein